MDFVKLILYQLLLVWSFSSAGRVKQLTWKSDPHKHVTLRSGEKMPLVGYGTWQSEDKILEDALEKALEAGYRHIDTATLYNNEHIIGNVLHKWLSSGKIKRDDLFITTKLPAYGIQPELVSKFIHESLNKLQLHYVDMYLVHVPFYVPESGGYNEDGTVKILPVDILAVWKEMEKLVDEGKTKSIGISNVNEKQIEKIFKHGRIKPSNVQVELHLYLQQKSLVDFCKKHEIVVTSYSTLGSRGTFQTFLKGQEVPPSVLEDEVVLKIAKKHNKSPAQILLRYMVQQEIVVIPKSTNEQRIKENAELFDFHLSHTETNELCKLDKGEKGRILRFSTVFKGLEKHPEYPFPY